jgi:8-hydroxy-5-deazaflavin:NADPH oxidoreductase
LELSVLVKSPRLLQNFLLPSMELADLKGRVSSEIVSECAPSARVVKALNTLYASNLARDPKERKGRRVIFISGDDAEAKGQVNGLLKSLGFAVIDLGSLREGGRAQQVGNGLAGLDLVQLGADDQMPYKRRRRCERFT